MGTQSNCLWVYAITSTLVSIIFICLYSTCGSEQNIVAGDEKKIVKYDILSIDQSETADDMEGCTCLNGFTVLELIVITLMGLGLIVLLIKLLLKGKKKYKNLAKRRYVTSTLLFYFCKCSTILCQINCKCSTILVS